MLVLCETQRNTWKPWQGDEIWQRSFRVPVHPQENDVLFIVPVVKVISIDYRLDWHRSRTGENLPDSIRLPGHQLRAEPKVWDTEPGHQHSPWAPASAPSNVVWEGPMHTDIPVFSPLLHKSIAGMWCKDCKRRSDLSKWQHLVCYKVRCRLGWKCACCKHGKCGRQGRGAVLSCDGSCHIVLDQVKLLSSGTESQGINRGEAELTQVCT